MRVREPPPSNPRITNLSPQQKCTLMRNAPHPNPLPQSNLTLVIHINFPLAPLGTTAPLGRGCSPCKCLHVFFFPSTWNRFLGTVALGILRRETCYTNGEHTTEDPLDHLRQAVVQLSLQDQLSCFLHLTAQDLAWKEKAFVATLNRWIKQYGTLTLEFWN